MVAAVGGRRGGGGCGGRCGGCITTAGCCTRITAGFGAHGAEFSPNPRCHRRSGAPRGHLLHGPRVVAGSPCGHAPGAPDQLCVRAQQVFLRLGSARSVGGFADRGRGAATSGRPSGGARCSMTWIVRRRASWLIPCAVVGALLTALPQRSSGADDPRDWLQKMNQALATRNYDGTFFHLSEGRVETMRIVHRVRAGRVTERLQSLDGSGREFVRNNDELTCYLPDQHTILVEPRPDHGPFLGSLPQFGADVNEFYRIESLPATHILGRAARVIAVNPKDQFRFGYRLWLDEKTAMPLKTQLCDSRGQVIEQILFARLEMPENIPDSDLAPSVRTEGMRWVRQGPARDNASAALAAFRAR